jgi:hypothetical protein
LAAGLENPHRFGNRHLPFSYVVQCLVGGHEVE